MCHPLFGPIPARGVELETFIPWALVKRGVKNEIMISIDAPEARWVRTLRIRARQVH